VFGRSCSVNNVPRPSVIRWGSSYTTSAKTRLMHVLTNETSVDVDRLLNDSFAKLMTSQLCRRHLYCCCCVFIDYSMSDIESSVCNILTMHWTAEGNLLSESWQVHRWPVTWRNFVVCQLPAETETAAAVWVSALREFWYNALCLFSCR